MELIDRRNKIYGHPSQLKAVEQEHDVRASYGPSQWNLTHDVTVRGVPVQKLNIRYSDKGRMYSWCVFPDGRVMAVNEGNIWAKKHPPVIGLHHVATKH